jgi:hypothetical protein
MAAVKLDDVGKLLTQLQSLFSGALPWTASQFQLLPFLNPVISKEHWPISSVLAIIASSITFNLAKRFQKPTWARLLAIGGLLLSIILILLLYALVNNLFPSLSPELQDLYARSAFVLLFVGLGLAAGWGFSYVL